MSKKHFRTTFWGGIVFLGISVYCVCSFIALYMLQDISIHRSLLILYFMSILSFFMLGYFTWEYVLIKMDVYTQYVAHLLTSKQYKEGRSHERKI